MLFYQPPEGYRYNSDSIFLFQFIKSHKLRGKVLDVGSGVGIISALIVKNFNVEISLIDKQPKAIEYSKKNFEINLLKGKFYEGDFLEVEFRDRFDFIVSNPPFYDSNVIQSQNNSLNTSRYSHHLPIEKFIFKVKKLLNPKGYFIFCYDAKQIDKILFELIKNRLQPERIKFIHPKIGKKAKTVMITARANSKSFLDVEPPLIVFDEVSRYLPMAKKAFLDANSYSITAEI